MLFCQSKEHYSRLDVQQFVTWVLLSWIGVLATSYNLRRFQKINVNKPLHLTVTNLANIWIKAFYVFKKIKARTFTLPNDFLTDNFRHLCKIIIYKFLKKIQT